MCSPHPPASNHLNTPLSICQTSTLITKFFTEPSLSDPSIPDLLSEKTFTPPTETADQPNVLFCYAPCRPTRPQVLLAPPHALTPPPIHHQSIIAQLDPPMMQFVDSLFEDLTPPNVMASSPPSAVFPLTDSFHQTTTVTYTTSTITTRPSLYPDQPSLIYQTSVPKIPHHPFLDFLILSLNTHVQFWTLAEIFLIWH